MYVPGVRYLGRGFASSVEHSPISSMSLQGVYSRSLYLVGTNDVKGGTYDICNRCTTSCGMSVCTHGQNFDKIAQYAEGCQTATTVLLYYARGGRDDGLIFNTACHSKTVKSHTTPSMIRSKQRHTEQLST